MVNGLLGTDSARLASTTKRPHENRWSAQVPSFGDPAGGTQVSGSLRVRVYAGVDALTGRRHYLTESVPAGPKAYAEAEKIRRRLVNQVDEQRNPRTKATVNQLMDRYHELVPTVAPSQLDGLCVGFAQTDGLLELLHAHVISTASEASPCC